MFHTLEEGIILVKDKKTIMYENENFAVLMKRLNDM